METLIRVMLSVFLIGMVVATIVFFSVFGLLPAEKLTQVLKGEPQPTGTSTVVVSTTTIIERIIERPDEDEDDEDQQDTSDQQQDTQQDNNQQQDNTNQDTSNNQQDSQDSEDTTDQNTTTTQSLPPAVFNTSGEVSSVEGSVIFVASDGSHMETIPPSGVVDVEVTVTNSTNFLDEDNNEISLSDIKSGDSISIEASGNIKNETEFEASNVRITN